MPNHGLLSCAIEIGESNTPLREYGTTYFNRTVETYVAIPSKPVPFSIRLSSTSYVGPGLSIWIYIDGLYQTNRNKRGAVPPDGKLEFHLGQKEDLLKDGRVVARGWWFESLNIVNGDAKPAINDDVFSNLGTIEVVVLRCEDDPNSVPVNPWKFSQLPTTEKTTKKATTEPAPSKQSNKQGKTAKTSSIKDDNCDGLFGGIFGLFDGAADELPQRASSRFRGFDGHYDHEQRRRSVSHQFVSHHKDPCQDVKDGMTRTSSGEYENAPLRPSGTYEDSWSRNADYGEKRYPQVAYRPSRQRDRPLKKERRSQLHHPSAYFDLPLPLHKEYIEELGYRTRGSRGFDRMANNNTLRHPQHLSMTPHRNQIGSRYSRLRHKNDCATGHCEHKIDKNYLYEQSPTGAEYGSEQGYWNEDICCYPYDTDEADDEDPHFEPVLELDGTAKEFHRHWRKQLQDSDHEYSAIDIPQSRKPVGSSRVRVPQPANLHRSLSARRWSQERRQRSNPHATPARNLPHEPAGLPGNACHVARRTHIPQHNNLSRQPLNAEGYRRHWNHTPPAVMPLHVSQAAWQQLDAGKALEIKEVEKRLRKLKKGESHVPRQPAKYVYGPLLPRHRAPVYEPSYFYTLPFEPQPLQLPPNYRLVIPAQPTEARSMAQWWGWGNDMGHVTQNNRDRSLSPDWDAVSSTSENDAAQQIGDNNQANTSGSRGNDNSQKGNQQSGGGDLTNGNNQNDCNQQSEGRGLGDDDCNNSKNDHNDSKNGNDNGLGADNNQNSDKKSSQSNHDDWGNQGGQWGGQQNGNEWGGSGWDNDNDKKDYSKSKSKSQKGSKSSTPNNESKEKPYTRSYWHLRDRSEANRADANGSRKQDKYTMPEDPIYTISEDTAKSKHLKHQVRGGRGAEQEKRIYTPIYWDSLEEPYAVFRFKYRSQDMLKEILGEDIGESKEEFKEWVRTLTREQLIAEMLRKEASSWARDDENVTKKKEKKDKKMSGDQHQGNNGSWGNTDGGDTQAGGNYAGGDWNNGGVDRGVEYQGHW